MQTAPKEVICVGSDHTDRGAELKNAIVDYLRERGKEVIILEQGSSDDSYIHIACRACYKIRIKPVVSKRRPERLMPDSAILIDQLGEAMAATANAFLGIIAVTADCPQKAYELTRKNNPKVLCIPTQVSDIANDVLVKNTKSNVTRTVEKWLDTEFLQDASPEEAKRWFERQKESELIHYKHIMSLIERGE